jgi:hypothetical protein
MGHAASLAEHQLLERDARQDVPDERVQAFDDRPNGAVVGVDALGEVAGKRLAVMVHLVLVENLDYV